MFRSYYSVFKLQISEFLNNFFQFVYYIFEIFSGNRFFMNLSLSDLEYFAEENPSGFLKYTALMVSHDLLGELQNNDIWIVFQSISGDQVDRLDESNRELKILLWVLGHSETVKAFGGFAPQALFDGIFYTYKSNQLRSTELKNFPSLPNYRDTLGWKF